VFYRDIAPVEAIVLQFWFWLTPIIYPLSIVPPALQGFIEANPATAIARAYQDIFVASRWPDFASLAGPGLLALVAAVAGYRFFRSRSADMVDEL
jgi:lipopolysaccharide transport system permease protein